MTAATGRRRPAVPVHPLAAVPAATVARVLPAQPLGYARPAGTVVHALGQVDEATGMRRPRCATRLHWVDGWNGEPMRMCSLCAAALGFPSQVPGWRPTRAELAEVHLAAADRITTELAEALADVRSAAIFDGSALLRVDDVPSWRAEHRIPDDIPPRPLPATQIVGELLTLPTAAVARSNDRATQLVLQGDSVRREERADMRAARQFTRDHAPRCPHCGVTVMVARDHTTEETVLVNLKRVHGGRVTLNRLPGSPEIAVAVDHITRPAPAQPAFELHCRTCPGWPTAEPTNLDDDPVREQTGGWRS